MQKFSFCSTGLDNRKYVPQGSTLVREEFCGCFSVMFAAKTYSKGSSRHYRGTEAQIITAVLMQCNGVNFLVEYFFF